MSAGDELIATPSQTVGPFFHSGLHPNRAVGNQGLVDRGEATTLRLSVLDGDGLPVPDAWLEVWEGGGDAEAVVGRLPTGEDGACEFEIAKPVAHLNVCVFARGLLRHLTTRVYFPADAGLATDPVLALVPAGRRATLMAMVDEQDSRQWRFDIRLQGDDETVFFDV